MTNCINCGAVLKGNICEYCGTRYTDEKLTVYLGADEIMGELKLGEKAYKVYLARIEGMPFITGGVFRDAEGNLHRGSTVLK